MTKQLELPFSEEVEIWARYNFYYEVSTLGRVRSLQRVVIRPQGAYIKGDKILKLTPNCSGYYHLKLYRGDASFENAVIHRLVALLFIPNPLDKPIINHKNGIKIDNRVENLEWCTSSENIKHAYDTGLIKTISNSGENNRSSVLNNKSVMEIRNKHSTGLYTYPMLSKEYDVSTSNILAVVKRQTWKHI